jgi:hypothetical protein
MGARIFAGSAAGVIEERRRRSLAAERLVITDVSPAGDGLQFRQHRHGGVVNMEPIGGEDMTTDCLKNGIKGCNAGANPASQSGDIDFGAFARIGLALPI